MSESKGALTTELRIVQGRPTLFVNGRPHHRIFCSTPARYMRNFIDAGFDVFDTHPNTPHGWVGPGEYDYTETDARIESYLDQKPDALLILRFWIGQDQKKHWGTPWWSFQNPDETLRTTADGAALDKPSFASLKWRVAAGEALRRAVEHIEAKYGQNILAYVPGGGPCGEWFHWYAYAEQSNWEKPGAPALEDYSAPMKAAYREYLQEKYGTIGALNRAWDGEYPSFDAVQLPSPEARLGATEGHLRCLPREQGLVDFYEIFNRVVADTLVDWAAQVKRGCGGNKVVMVFYGYQWASHMGLNQPRTGHIDMDAVLNSPDVDYIVAPINYSFRQLDGVMSGQAVVAGPIRRGKQYMHELDGSTFLKACWPCRDHHNPADAAQTGELMRRDLGKALVEDSTVWYMDLMHGMYDDPGLVSELRRALQVGKEHSFSAGANDRQVAVVLNSRDPFYYREGEPLLHSLTCMFKQFELERMGLGYDDLILDDLNALGPEETAQYKLWIFPTAAHLTERELQNVRRHCCRNRNYVLWNYAAGVVGEDGLSLERMKEVTGFDCGYTMAPGEVTVRTVDAPHALLQGLDSPLTYGTRGDLSADDIRYHAALKSYPTSEQGFQVTPRFFIQECDEALGQALDLPGGERPGLGVRDMGEWVSVLSVAPLLRREILRNIAREAGCHVFTDFLGNTYQCENYFGIFCHESGACRVDFPHPSRVTEVYRGEALAEHADSVEFEAEQNKAYLFHYEPATLE
ncbi:MAG: family 14 glycosylhydrolase [Planctomycetes bacterium]|nr:family 14 glycosylhydrolase [Planctomycetota bacterium]